MIAEVASIANIALCLYGDHNDIEVETKKSGNNSARSGAIISTLLYRLSPYLFDVLNLPLPFGCGYQRYYRIIPPLLCRFIGGSLCRCFRPSQHRHCQAFQ